MVEVHVHDRSLILDRVLIIRVVWFCLHTARPLRVTVTPDHCDRNLQQFSLFPLDARPTDNDQLFTGSAMPKRKNSKQHKRRVSTDSDPDPPRYEDTTDRSDMDRPVAQHCAPAMANRWKIYKTFPSYILFDAVNPTRVFKKGTVYNEADPDPFPTPNLRDTRDETDRDPDGTLQQYKPKPHM
jgi:hypothetical protein